MLGRASRRLRYANVQARPFTISRNEITVVRARCARRGKTSIGEPLIARFDLPAAIAEDGFNASPYIDRLIKYADQVLR